MTDLQQPVDRNTAAGKLLAVLDAFGQETAELTLAAAARRAALPKTTVHRLLRVLESWGGIERTATGAYRLGDKLTELADLAQAQRRLGNTAPP